MVEADSEYIEIMLKKNDDYLGTICVIHKTERYVTDLMWQVYIRLSDDEKRELFETVTEFAATNPEDREDKDNLDLIIHKLKEIQADAEGIISWEDISIIWTDIARKSRELKNNLGDIVIDLEEYKKSVSNE